MKRGLLLLAVVATNAAAQQAPADSSGSLVDRAARQYRAAKSVRASFDQTLSAPATGGVHPSHGDYVQSGSKFALRFTDPAGDAIVSDGKTLWLYLPSSAKGQVLKMPSQAGAGLDILSQLLAAPKDTYTSTRGGDETIDSHATTVYTLLPKKKDFAFSRAKLWIGKSDALIWQLETTEESGLIRKVRFTSVQTDVDLAQDAFAFNVPAGVRIIDSGSLLGKKP